MTWSSPADFQAQVERYWKRGEVLSAPFNEDRLFPMKLRLKKPKPADITERFDDVRQWVAELKAASREERGHGYTIKWREVNHRVHGKNLLPASVSVPTDHDAAALVGKTLEAKRFKRLFDEISDRHAMLRSWFAYRPMIALEREHEWPQILAVIDYLRDNPRPGLYTRQLDIPGVDSKFIERRRALLGELLDFMLPYEAVDFDTWGARNFNRRYGLRDVEPLVRFRVLDPALRIGGLDDLSVPAPDFAALDLDVERVFITENKINGLAFPQLKRAIVIFGLGYGVHTLREAAWLRDKDVRYWGDIDTHGFGVLQCLRNDLPRARSFLMDRETLLAHRPLWGEEPAGRRCTQDLSRLTKDERELYDELRADTHGPNIRLDQERIRYGAVERSLL